MPAGFQRDLRERGVHTPHPLLMPAELKDERTTKRVVVSFLSLLPHRRGDLEEKKKKTRREEREEVAEGELFQRRCAFLSLSK